METTGLPRRGTRQISTPLPEVHIIGEIVGGTAFGSVPVCCKFSVEAGDRWEWLAGTTNGQTQTVHPEDGSDLAVWAHPLDLHYVAGTLSVSPCDCSGCLFLPSLM
jgi:hypothetical protein